MDETYFKQSYAYAYAQLRQPIPSYRRRVESAVAVASLAVRLVSAEAQCCPRVHPQVAARPAPSVTGRSAVLRPGTCTQHPGILWQGGDNGPKEIPCLTSPTLCPASLGCLHQRTNGPSGDFVWGFCPPASRRGRLLVHIRMLRLVNRFRWRDRSSPIMRHPRRNH
jgi:hypothetical protein